jgi:hypothetical protein
MTKYRNLSPIVPMIVPPPSPFPIKENHHVFLFWENAKGILPPMYKIALKSILRAFGTERVIIASKTLEKEEPWYPRIWREYEEDVMDPVLLNRIMKHKQSQGPHLADMFRLSVLYKYGGIYTDADALWVNPIELGDGFLTMVNSRLVSNGCIGMPARHPFLTEVMRLLPSTYDTRCWNCMGSGLLSKVYNKCGIACNLFKRVDYITMYTIQWDKSKHAMEVPADDVAFNRLKNGTNHQLHIYGKINGKRETFQPGTIYDKAVKYINAVAP